MKPVLIAGSFIVTLALISYSIAFIRFHRKRKISSRVLTFQTMGVILDIAATTMMIIGSEKGPFTVHGILGYSSLSLMILDTLFFWNKRKTDAVPAWLTNYSRIAYFWWILAYITGSLIVALR